MAALEGVEGLRSLQQDLLALSSQQLPALDSLCLQLEGNIAAFKKLLDKNGRNLESRKALATGTGIPPWDHDRANKL